jgi:hypothetical protein
MKVLIDFLEISHKIKRIENNYFQFFFILRKSIDMSEKFELVSKYSPAGDQGEAIEEIVQNLKKKEKFQTLW